MAQDGSFWLFLHGFLWRPEPESSPATIRIIMVPPSVWSRKLLIIKESCSIPLLKSVELKISRQVSVAAQPMLSDFTLAAGGKPTNPTVQEALSAALTIENSPTEKLSKVGKKKGIRAFFQRTWRVQRTFLFCLCDNEAEPLEVPPQPPLQDSADPQPGPSGHLSHVQLIPSQLMQKKERHTHLGWNEGESLKQHSSNGGFPPSKFMTLTFKVQTHKRTMSLQHRLLITLNH
ncbi:uncharacterized protein LOC127416774 [Myxocyprinus asiaticus]|uniref:uncharacterized protein LOC127416774 n=1 Tax=Myxocyprinus asiaticus TaxID=70543 RepID=UPI002221BF4F|nr:uncharacterized protein LOC127416774 [Myxocyprinus asiaticus]